MEQKPAIMGLLWAFNIKIGNDKVRDPETPVTFEDFTPVSYQVCFVLGY